MAFADGVGSPLDVLRDLSSAAADAGGVRLLLGWTVAALDGLDPAVFERVTTIMSGFALRPLVDAGVVGYIPVRIGAVPALVRDVLRPDVVVASVVPGPDGYRFGSEVSWLRAAVEAGAVIAAVERPALPACDAGSPLPENQLAVISSSAQPPVALPVTTPGDAHKALGERVARLVPAGCRLQVGPGPLGSAVCDALTAPVRITAGLLADSVVNLDQRGLLLDPPTGAYLAGSELLYSWATGQPLLYPFDVTHDPARLGSRGPFVAVNTALQIDLDGQVNVEQLSGSTVGGIGGHPDFAFAAAGSRGGLSVMALLTESRGRSTLVERLDGPVTTPGHDVDVVVTERGSADLRGLDRRERRAAIAALWD